MKTLTNKKGFTLIELIVVIAILGVLALILVPQFMGYVDDADIQTQRANVKTVYDASMASLAKLRTIPETGNRTDTKFSEMLGKSLGDSFDKSQLSVSVKDGSFTSIVNGNGNGSGSALYNPEISSITYQGCIYTPSTNTYTGTCADVTGS